MLLLKKFFLLSLILAFCSCAFCSCGNDDDDSNTSEQTSEEDTSDDDVSVTYTYIGTQTAGDFWQLEQVYADSTLETGTIFLDDVCCKKL